MSSLSSPPLTPFVSKSKPIQPPENNPHPGMEEDVYSRERQAHAALTASLEARRGQSESAPFLLFSRRSSSPKFSLAITEQLLSAFSVSFAFISLRKPTHQHQTQQPRALRIPRFRRDLNSELPPLGDPEATDHPLHGGIHGSIGF